MTYQILIVDDNDTLRDMYSLYISAKGYAVHSAPGVAQAIELIEKNQYDLIMTDHLMPTHAGIELVRAVRYHPNPVIAAVLIIVASAVDTITSLYLEAGANQVLTKPILLSDLEIIIQTQLANRR